MKIQLDQALQALKRSQDLLSDIEVMAQIAREEGRESITFYLDDDGILPDIRCAMINNELVLKAQAQREASSDIVSQWAAETMGLPLLARRAE